MKKSLLLIFVFFIFWGCRTDTKTSFIYLNLHKKQFTENEKPYNDSLTGLKLYESILIKNPPANNDSLIIVMSSYFDTLNKDGNKNIQYAYRTMKFYKYSDKTQPFISVERDASLLSRVYLDDQIEDFLGFIKFERCAEDSLKGIKIIEARNIIDTVFNTCEK